MRLDRDFSWCVGLSVIASLPKSRPQLVPRHEVANSQPACNPLTKQLVKNPIILRIEVFLIDEVADDFVVDEGQLIEPTGARLTRTRSILIGVAMQPGVHKFLVVEVEFSELSPPRLIVQTDV